MLASPQVDPLAGAGVDHENGAIGTRSPLREGIGHIIEGQGLKRDVHIVHGVVDRVAAHVGADRFAGGGGHFVPFPYLMSSD